MPFRSADESRSFCHFPQGPLRRLSRPGPERYAQCKAHPDFVPFVRHFCRLYPVQVAKTVRLRLPLVRQMLARDRQGDVGCNITNITHALMQTKN